MPMDPMDPSISFNHFLTEIIERADMTGLWCLCLHTQFAFVSRKVFERAAAAAPAVIFFDEIEADWDPIWMF